MEVRDINFNIINRFKEHLYNEEKSSVTIEKYIHDIKCFAEFVNGHNIDKSMILEYKKSLADSYAITSANSMIAALNAFLGQR